MTSVQAWLFAPGMPNGMYVLIVVVALWTMGMVTAYSARAIRRLRREYAAVSEDYERVRTAYNAVLTLCEGRTMLAPNTGELVGAE